MRRSSVSLAIAGLGLLLAACAPQYGGIIAPPAGDLTSARQTCNDQYPRRIGNFYPHAMCVNAAIEAYAVPTARYPDLVRLQEDARARISADIDRRAVGIAAGERRMARIDGLVKQAERDRDRGAIDEARNRVERIHTMLR